MYVSEITGGKLFYLLRKAFEMYVFLYQFSKRARIEG